MIDKFAKRENCLYCERAMEAKNRSKKFCSIKCRVYFNREKGKAIPNDIPPVITEPKSLPILIKKTEVKIVEKKEVEIDVIKKVRNEAPDPTDKTAYFKWLRNNQ